MKALPSDLAKGPGFRPSHEQVLAEVEERLWIAKHQLDDELGKAAAAPEWRNAGADANAIKPQITGALATGTLQSRSPELQRLFDRHRALNLLVRELRHSMDLPVRPAGAEFSRPKLSPEIEASYRALNFDPLGGLCRLSARQGSLSVRRRQAPGPCCPLSPGCHGKGQAHHPQP
jgi:hypothetical protein